MAQTMFRKESLDHISSPEQLNDYLHVTTPTVWVILLAVIILLAGIMVWGSFTTIESFAGGTAQVEDGVLTLYFEDVNIADSVEPGMDIIVGDDVMTVRSVGQTAYGVPFAVADTTLADGTYSARVAYDEVQLIRLLFR